MKKLLLLIILALSISIVSAQTVPQGINYQGVLRDISGQAIKNQQILIKVNIQNEDQRNIFYSEIHETNISPEGIFNVVIGKGEPLHNDFKDVPWGSDNLWVEVQFNVDPGEDKWESSGAMQLLSVPYALYAEKAGQVDGEESPGKSSSLLDGTYAFWTVQGNYVGQFSPPPTVTTQQLLDNPEIFPNFLGTLGTSPLVLKVGGRTNAFFAPRSGDFHMLREAFFYHDVNISGNLTVDANAIIGENAFIGNNIEVGNNGLIGNNFRINNNLSVGNNGIIENDLRVNNNLSVGNDGLIENDLRVDNDISIGNNGLVENDFRIDNNLSVGNDGLIENDLRVDNDLSVGNNAFFDNNLLVRNDLRVDNDFSVGGNTFLEENLTVQGDAAFEGNLSVDDNLSIGNNLEVENDAFINNELVVGGKTTINNLLTIDHTIIGSQSDQSSYPLLIRGSEQGLAIQVNKSAQSAFSSGRGNNYISFWTDQSTMEGRIEGMSRADLDPTGLVSLISSIVSTNVSGVNRSFQGNVLSNPFSLSTGVGSAVTDIISFVTGNFSSGNFVNSVGLNFSSNGFNPGNFSTILGNGASQLPVQNYLGGSFNGNNGPGTPASFIWNSIRQNLFDEDGIFTQAAGPEGATNFESQLFSNYTLDILTSSISVFSSVLQFIASFASILDPVDVLIWAIDMASQIINLIIYGSYADINIGVAYESGSGDYAEWLLRAFPDETIMPGDVVGVIGGKVSKSFVNADKFMAVSTAPIVLGNMPEDREKEENSEKIAFMGQVPVKVKGAVQIGDYILPSGDGDGTAIAVHPDNMKVKDYPRIVGVAWSEDTKGDFIKMINTAVGINNNDMSKVIIDLQSRMNAIQLALMEIHPNFQPELYDLDEEYSILEANTRDYTVSDVHVSNLKKHFKDHSFSDQKEMLAEVKSVMKYNYNIDLDEFPLIAQIFDEPETIPVIESYFAGWRNEFVGLKAGIESHIQTKKDQD